MVPGMRRRRVLRVTLLYAALAPFLLVALFPIAFMVITAFKQEADLYRMGNIPFWFNLAPTLHNFDLLFRQTHFLTWLANTFFLCVWVVGLTVLFAVPAGYALARLSLPGAENAGMAIFMTYLVPAIILFLPLARVVGALGLWDSWWALVVVYPTFTIPFCTWFMIGFFRSVPREIEDAALVDGCGLLGAALRVVLPLSRPGLLITAIFAFTLSMQEFLYAVVYVAPRAEKTVTVGVATVLIRGDIYFWGSLMAAALIVSLPLALLYNVVLDRFIEGLTRI